MANPNPTPPPVQHRFTPYNAASHGRRGAAARERRFLEGLGPAEVREREQLEQLRWATAAVRAVFGPPWRPRRSTPRDPVAAVQAWLAIDVLARLLDGATWRIRLGAIGAFVGLLRFPVFSPVRRPRRPPATWSPSREQHAHLVAAYLRENGPVGWTEMSRDLRYLYGMGRTRLSGALGRLEETGRLDHEPRGPYALRSVDEGDGHLEGSRGLAIAG